MDKEIKLISFSFLKTFLKKFVQR